MSVIQNRSAFVRRLAARGNVTEAAAEDIADALDADLQEPATKLDLARVEMRIAELRAEVKTETAGLRADSAMLRAEIKTETATLRIETERSFNRALIIQLAMLGALFAALRLT